MERLPAISWEVGKRTALWHGHGPMRRSRLGSWWLVAFFAACRSEPERMPGPFDPPPSDPTFDAAGGSGGGGGNGGSSATGGAGPRDAGTNLDAARTDGSSDARSDTPNIVIHQDAAGGTVNCAQDRAVFGSNRLLAGGATPPDFAAAYNADLTASNTAGPLLFLFRGVNETNLLDWIASVGALEPRDAGGGVGFTGPRADVPFTLASDRTLRIATIAAPFGLRHISEGNVISIPVGSIGLAGSLSVGCGSLTVTNATLLVPASAGTIVFHGAPLADAMGPPKETLGGVPNSAWPLELAGKAQQVDAPGLDADGGIEP